MRLEVYHQLGHFYQWNLASFSEDSVGDGLILAPRYMRRSVVQNLGPDIKETAVFDPQFFLPNVARGELQTYDFFPHLVGGGFDTEAYVGQAAKEGAHKCVAFQLEQGFRYLVVPARYMAGMPSDYCEQQQQLLVDPFMAAIRDHGGTKPVIVQLVLDGNVMKDETQRAEVLDWVTGIRGIHGVYLIWELSRRSKQIKDLDFLHCLMNFIWSLRENSLDVITGYVNTEALLLSIADPSAVTLGAFETTRWFRPAPWTPPVDERRTGPAPRLYVPAMLQWVDHTFVGAISRELDVDMGFFGDNRYLAAMMGRRPWNFRQPDVYKHYFVEFDKQLRAVGGLDGVDRYRVVCAMMEQAKGIHERLLSEGVILDSDSDGSHLAPWLTVAHSFAKERGWR